MENKSFVESNLLKEGCVYRDLGKIYGMYLVKHFFIESILGDAYE